MADLPAVQFEHYYRHQELSEHLQALAAAAPDRVRLHELYRTPEGREEWLAEVTDFSEGDARTKPGYLVHANLHALEVSGTTAALVLLEELLTNQAHQELLREVVFYVIPRINPDGAEYGLVTGGQIRSKLEYRPRRNGLVAGDLNGDGLILQMRWQDPYGSFRADDEDPRLMVSRKPDDTGPFYSMAREGLIEDYDGGHIQDAVRSFDFNRNWGYGWQPEHIQYGAGDYSFSNPEMKAVADWVYSHPTIFGLLGFHNGCNAVLRPSATVPDDEINPADLRMMRELGEMGEQLTGFGLRAVRDYRGDDARPISLKGHFTDWTYFSLGVLGFEIELGSIYNAAGISTAEYFAADEHKREVIFGRRIMEYASDNDGFVDWQPFDHPQLGPVEIGGLKSTFWATPPPHALQRIGEDCADFVIDHAGRRPKLEIHDLQARLIEGSVYHVTATVANVGGMSTQITEQGHRMLNNTPVTVRLEHGEQVEVLSRSEVFEVGSLQPLTGHADLEWFIRGRQGSRVAVRAAATKAGVAREETVLG